MSLLQTVSWAYQQRPDNQHMPVRANAWICEQRAVMSVAFSASPVPTVCSGSECTNSSARTACLSKCSCALTVLCCLEMSWPCYMKMTVLSCASSCLLRSNKRSGIQSLSLQLLLEKVADALEKDDSKWCLSGKHPWGYKAYVRRSGDTERNLWIVSTRSCRGQGIFLILRFSLCEASLLPSDQPWLQFLCLSPASLHLVLMCKWSSVPCLHK